MPEQKPDPKDLIHKLATRLPWIVVLVTLLTAVLTILQIFFFNK